LFAGKHNSETQDSNPEEVLHTWLGYTYWEFSHPRHWHSLPLWMDGSLIVPLMSCMLMASQSLNATTPMVALVVLPFSDPEPWNGVDGDK